MREPDDDLFLDDIAKEMEQLESRSPRDRLEDARSLIQRVMLTTLPDGSWPDAHLVQEALRAYLDIVETAFADDHDLLASLDAADRQWIDASRQCANSIQVLDDMLWDLRADIPQRGPNW